jgi:hypothetical protein
MKPECRQVAAMHWSERINGVRFNAHWLRIAILEIIDLSGPDL